MTSHEGAARLYENGKVIAEGFGADFHLHPLAVEDAVLDHERPKLERYPGHLFLNVYAVDIATEDGTSKFGKTEVSAFVTDRALITVRKSPSDTAHFVRRWEADPALAAEGGVAFLLYGLLDVIVDGQYAAAQKLDGGMDGVEHLRDRIEGLLPADLTEQSNQLNDITRKLAAWAAIIAVPTALTGYFGQNLPYPGYDKGWGLLLSSVLIVIAAGGLYRFLKRRGWL